MSILFDKDKAETHPSYGIAKFSRVSGGGNFFGTTINPQYYFTFEVCSGRKEISSLTGEELFYPDNRKPIVEVKMTAAQFTELITTMNIGSGVPVTIKGTEECPQQSSPIDHVFEKTQEGISEDTKFCNDYLSKVRDLLLAGKVGKKNIEEIVNRLNCVIGRQESTANFYKDQLIEVGEKVVSQVKAEIENTTVSIINRLGLKSLSQLKEIEEKIFIEKK